MQLLVPALGLFFEPGGAELLGGELAKRPEPMHVRRARLKERFSKQRLHELEPVGRGEQCFRGIDRERSTKDRQLRERDLFVFGQVLPRAIERIAQTSEHTGRASLELARREERPARSRENDRQRKSSERLEQTFEIG